MVDRGEDAERGVHASNRVAETEVRARRRPIGIAVHVAQSAETFRHGRVAWLLRVRPRLSPAGHARYDQARIDRLEILVAEPPLLEPAGTEVFDQHVAV